MTHEVATPESGAALRTSPHVVLVQRRLFAPSHQAAARWVVFDSRTRRSFLASGGRRYADRPSGPVSPIGAGNSTWPSWMEGRRHADVIPDVVVCLAAASRGGLPRDALVESGAVERAADVDHLVAAGLLGGFEGEEPADGAPFLARYHRAAFDYPFHDYFDEEWRSKDKAIMAEYKRAWPPPPPLTERSGALVQLPEVGHEAVRRQSGEPALTERALAALLATTLGVREWREEAVSGPLVRKTSPSGGSRHPTELVVLLPRDLGRIPAGAYHYDVARHALAPAPAYAEQAAATRAECAFFVVSHVERAMWRYREMRSFRPIPIDAGHIVETLSLLVGLRDLDVSVDAPGPASDSGFGWVEEPELAVVTVGGEPPPARRPAVAEPADDEPLVTNPALFATFGDGGLQARVLWPRLESVRLALADFQVLGHCLPSRRGDRDTRPRAIPDAIVETSAGRVRELCAAGALLPRSIGDRLDAAARLWARYDWYLSLLAHLEVTAHQRRGEPRGATRVARLGDSSKLLDSLARRRTHRAFPATPIPRGQLERILAEALSGTADDIAAFGAELTVVVAPLAVTGLPARAHEWRPIDRRLHPLDADVDRLGVREMTIGQEPVAQAAAVVWLFARMDLEAPAGYELVLLTLGRIGQRIALLATGEGLGAFMTPAVCDALTFRRLGLPGAERSVTYAFGIGNRHGGPRG